MVLQDIKTLLMIVHMCHTVVKFRNDSKTLKE